MKKHIDSSSRYNDQLEQPWFDVIASLKVKDKEFDESFELLRNVCFLGKDIPDDPDMDRMRAADKALRDVVKIFKPQLVEDIRVKEVEVDKKGYSMTGRQYVFMMYKHFTSTDVNLKLHSLTDLIKCEWMGDSEKDMKQYRNTAREIMDSIPENKLGRNEEIIKQQFQTALADQMSKSKDSLIIADMVHYNRAMTEPDVKGDYCYDYLWRRLNTRIKLFHQKDMTSQWRNKQRHGQRGVPDTAVAMATMDDETEHPTLTSFNGEKGTGEEQGTTPEDTEGKKKLCIRFQTGNCTGGDTCTYSHEKSKDPDALRNMLKVACAQNIRLTKKIEGGTGVNRTESQLLGKSQGKGKKRHEVNFCITFLKKLKPRCDGTCGREHLTQPEINERRKAIKAVQSGQ